MILRVGSGVLFGYGFPVTVELGCVLSALGMDPSPGLTFKFLVEFLARSRRDLACCLGLDPCVLLPSLLVDI